MSTISSKWWEYNKGDKGLSTCIFSLVKNLSTEQSQRTLMNKRHLLLYTTNPEVYFFGGGYTSQNTDPAYNIIQSLCDTMTAKITKNKPLPRFLTNAQTDWASYNKSRHLQKFIEGIFSVSNLYEVSTKCFKDSTIFGTGIMRLKINPFYQIEAYKVNPFDILIDDSETITGTPPRQIHERMFIQKDTLKEMFPALKMEIDRAQTKNTDWFISRNLTDMIEVIESFHLPSFPGAEDGKHTICISNVVLFHEQYDKTFFPYCFLRWNERPLGFWGQGLAEQAASYQRTLDRCVYVEERCVEASVPKVFIEVGSDVKATQLTNELGVVCYYKGVKPSFEAQWLVPSGLDQHIQNTISRCFETLGVGPLGSMNKPAAKRTDSATAFQTLYEIETERFADNEIRWENFHIQAAKIVIDLMRTLAAQTKNFKDIDVPGEHFLKQVDWKKMDLDDSQYEIQVYSQSDFPTTPAGRIEAVRNLIEIGMPRKDILRQLSIPDPNGFGDWENADLDDIDATIQKFVDGKDYERPEPIQNLKLGIERFSKSYLRYKTLGAPEDVLEKIRKWIDDAAQMLQASAIPEQTNVMTEGVNTITPPLA